MQDVLHEGAAERPSEVVSNQMSCGTLHSCPLQADVLLYTNKEWV
jgi:hypothetical protein